MSIILINVKLQNLPISNFGITNLYHTFASRKQSKGGLGRKIMRPTLVAKAKIHSFTDPAKPFTNI